MERREFVNLLGSGAAAAAWLFAAHAQQSLLPVVGYLCTRGPETDKPFVAAFLHGLKDGGYVDGKNIAVQFSWGDGSYDRLPELATDLVRRKVALILAAGGSPSALAAKSATATIPIVFVLGVDPVRSGLVANLNRPGSNITGLTSFGVELGAKRVELLQQLLPEITALHLLVNPTNPIALFEVRDVQAAADALGLRTHIHNASTEGELEAAFADLGQQQQIIALLVTADGFFNGQRQQIVALAARHAIPTMYELRESILAGGLVSYGPSFVELYRQAGTYAARILKGENVGDLPVLQPTKIELVINLKSARTLGLAVPPGVLARADEVIE